VLTLVESQSVERVRNGNPPVLAPDSAGRRTLTGGEVLFREGETRAHVFRIETGVICLTKTLPDGRNAVVEFAFPGDLVGLGYLDTHITGAQATVGTTLECLPLTALDADTADNAQSRARLSAAIEREVAFLTERPAPLQQVAALFVTLSRNNTYEGRDPAVLTDSLTCGVVAGYLRMTVDQLAALLTELESRGLVEGTDNGLRLKDLLALEALADGRS
jgi:CRP/FNR family transcriptional regulator, anaerobic regulatory protein